MATKTKLQKLETKYKKLTEQIQQAKNDRENIRSKHADGQVTDDQLKTAEFNLAELEKEMAGLNVDLFIARRDEAARLMPNAMKAA